VNHPENPKDSFFTTPTEQVLHLLVQQVFASTRTTDTYERET